MKLGPRPAVCFLAGALLVLLRVGPAPAQQPATAKASAAAPPVRVRIETEMGDIVAELYPDRAPVTVANFLRYVQGGHYRGGSFYRTVRDDNQPDAAFPIGVIQAGIHPWRQDLDPYPAIPLERTRDTGLHHVDGTLSMARDGPDTATWSFFICIGDQPELDFGGRRNPDGQGFAAFGRVVEGMDVVRRIQAAPAEGQALMPPIRIVDVVRLH